MRVINLCKTALVVAVALFFALDGIGFVAIGGEWFAMWQSKDWNGQQTAFEFIGMIGAVLIVLLVPEPAESQYDIEREMRQARQRPKQHEATA